MKLGTNEGACCPRCAVRVAFTMQSDDTID